MANLPTTVWLNPDLEVEYVQTGETNIVDPLLNILVDPLLNEVVDTAVEGIALPATVWAQDDSL